MNAPVDPEVHAAAERLLYRSFGMIDTGQASATADLFTPDATLTFGPGSPKPGTLQGTDITAAMTAREGQKNVTARHVLTNVIVDALAPDRCRMTSLLTLYRSETEARDTTVASVADIVDIIVRTNAGWRIASRTISPLFNRA